MKTESTQAALQALESALRERGMPRLFAGVDGFVDQIIRVVDKRFDAEHFEPIGPIHEYAARVASAAGKSTNIEFVVQEVKAGGNGPLMSGAFGRLGGTVCYVGSVGWPELDPLFKPLMAFGPVHPVAPAAQTLAAEFEDGKIMYGLHKSLHEVTWNNFRTRLGGEAALDECLRGADLLALLNWTMLPWLDEILDGVAERVLALGEEAPRLYFFDLCDPAKRTHEDIRAVTGRIARFGGEGRTAILGLNEKESLEVCAALGIPSGDDGTEGLVQRARRLVEATGIGEIVIHATRFAVAHSAGKSATAEGPYCPHPRLTTGAGDHFNGGYAFARVLGLSLDYALLVGKMTSGFYVRQGEGPTVEDLAVLADRWTAGSLDPWPPPGRDSGDRQNEPLAHD